MWKVNTFPNAWPSKWYEQPLVQISGTHVLQPSVNFGDQSPGLRNYLRAVCHWESSEAKIVYYKEQRCKWYAGKLLKKTVGSQAPFSVILTTTATPIKKNRKDAAIQSLLIRVWHTLSIDSIRVSEVKNNRV